MNQHNSILHFVLFKHDYNVQARQKSFDVIHWLVIILPSEVKRMDCMSQKEEKMKQKLLQELTNVSFYYVSMFCCSRYESFF